MHMCINSMCQPINTYAKNACTRMISSFKMKLNKPVVIFAKRKTSIGDALALCKMDGTVWYCSCMNAMTTIAETLYVLIHKIYPKLHRRRDGLMILRTSIEVYDAIQSISASHTARRKSPSLFFVCTYSPKNRPKKCNDVIPTHENAPSRFSVTNGTTSVYLVGNAPRSFVGKSNHDSSFIVVFFAAYTTFLPSNSSTRIAMLEATIKVFRILYLPVIKRPHAKTIAVDRISITAKLKKKFHIGPYSSSMS